MRDLNFELADYNGRKYIKYRYTDTDNKVYRNYVQNWWLCSKYDYKVI